MVIEGDTEVCVNTGGSSFCLPTQSLPGSTSVEMRMKESYTERSSDPLRTLRTTADRRMIVEETYPDKSLLCSAKLILTPGIPGLDVRMICIKAGVLFANGTINLNVNTSAFTPIPYTKLQETWWPYEMLMGSGTPGGVCHGFVVYQNNYQISY